MKIRTLFSSKFSEFPMFNFLILKLFSHPSTTEVGSDGHSGETNEQVSSELNRLKVVQDKLKESQDILKERQDILKESQDILKENSDQLKANLDSLKTTIERQSEQIGRLESGMEARITEVKSELKKQTQNMDITQPVGSFKFVLNDVSRFFESDKNERFSDRFWCGGLQWSLKVESNLKSKRSYLGFYLRAENDDSLQWSCKTEFQLILFSNSSDRPDHTDQLEYTFEEAGDSWGYSNYFSYLELIDPANGYIKDDQIVLGVRLQTGPVIRKM